MVSMQCCMGYCRLMGQLLLGITTSSYFQEKPLSHLSGWWWASTGMHGCGLAVNLRRPCSRQLHCWPVHGACTMVGVQARAWRSSLMLHDVT